MLKREGLIEIWVRVKDFKLILLFYLVLLILGIIILLFLPPAISCQIQSSQTSIPCQLTASPQTPWGVVTSILVNANWNDLLNEYATLFFSIFLFILINLNLEKKDRVRRSKFFVYASFLIMAFSTLLWILLFGKNNYSRGLSGITYAGMSLVLGFAIMNFVKEFKLLSKGLLLDKGIISLNLLIAGLLAFYAIFLPATFFNISNGTNVFIHEITFLFGFIIGLAYVIIAK
jgi:hypothetical protein